MKPTDLLDSYEIKYHVLNWSHDGIYYWFSSNGRKVNKQIESYKQGFDRWGTFFSESFSDHFLDAIKLGLEK